MARYTSWNFLQATATTFFYHTAIIIIVVESPPRTDMSSKVITVAFAGLTLMALVVLPRTSAAPAQYPQPPLAYNLHSAFTAEDINQLSSKSRHNIARTIAEVEKVLASDPKLPRLTR